MPNIHDPRLFGLGDFAVDDDFYDQHVVQLDTLRMLAAPGWEALPLTFDARDRKWVTPAKNQGHCGSCWAHASAGTMESRLLKEGYPAFDLSEQQLISCNTTMKGCCGGSGQSLMFYKTNRPWREQDSAYAESGTSCPTQWTKTSGDFPDIVGIGYLATGFYSIDRTTEAMKQSLVSDGPFYFRYDVYDDFYDYWSHGTSKDNYLQATGGRQGGHAVLLIGWNDTRNAWLIKNSWGNDTGPNKDGTFWMRYGGHANDLKFQGFNLSGIRAVRP
jgi:C1A family cysteine protease